MSAGSAVKYIALPGILPRLKELFFSGFAMLAYYVALIYGMAKLIPPGHPYLNSDNIGRFGIRQAIFEAWKNLDFKWKNADRVLFFFALISGLVMILAYIIGSVFFLLTAPAMAAVDIQIGDLFTNPNTHDDIAFMMMDKMLGIPDLFNSKIATDQSDGPFPSPFHVGLQVLFTYFSWGLFAIAMVMFLYFVLEVVFETTMTGTPFGQHFENFWVPVRLIAGLGLLIPISYGMNSAQFITLYAAKMGSNLATNAWIAFNYAMDNPLGMENKELVAVPVTPDFTGFAKDLFTIRACSDLQKRLKFGKPASTVDPDGSIVVTGTPIYIDAYFVDGERYFAILGHGHQTGKNWPGDYASNFINIYLEGLRFYKGKDVRIVFGHRSDEYINKYPGGVEPTCGEVLIPNLLPAGQKIPDGNIANADINQGVLIGASHMFAVLKMVYDVSKTGFGDAAGGDDAYNYYLMRDATDRYWLLDTSAGRRYQALQKEKIDQENADNPDDPSEKNPNCVNDRDNDGYDDDNNSIGDSMTNFKELGKCTEPLANEFFINLVKRYQRFFSYGPIMGYDYYTGRGQEILDNRFTAIDCGNVVSGAQDSCKLLSDDAKATKDGYSDYKPLGSVYYKDLGQDNPFTIKRSINSDLFKYGWGGAGIWYKIIAERNGELMGSTNALPRTTSYPLLMNAVASEKGANDRSTPKGGCERFNPQKSGDAVISLPGNIDGAHELADLYYSICNNTQENEYVKLPGTHAQKTGNVVLDVINALFGTKALFDFRENSAVNPMAQLAALGRALLDKAIQNIMMAAGGSAVGGLVSLLGQTLGTDAGSASALAMGGGTILLTLSKMLVGFAMIGLTAGVLLYYVIPFLPFMYFFFAVGTWVKTVFEALCGVPLWALAHIRLGGGPGFSGKAASGGYFMILEIMIRPILTVISLIAAMFTFMALAYVLNTTWGLVTTNLVGFDPVTQMSSNKLDTAFYRPKIDQFFFTIIYIIFMYMLATGSFKLIDQIPDTIMRWIADVKTWGVNDSADEMVGNVSQTVGIPVYQAVSTVVPAGIDMIGTVPKDVGGIVNDLRNNIPKPPSTPPSGSAGR